MTLTQSYRVIVTGKKLIEEVDTIREKLLEIFDLPEQQLTALLSDKALVIKKNVPPSHAMKFKKALTQCGLECMVEPMNEESIVEASDLDEQKPSAKPVPAQQANPQPQSDSPPAPKPAPESVKQPTAVKPPETPQPSVAEKPAEAVADLSNRSIPPSLVGKSGEDIVVPELLVAAAGSRIGPRPMLVNTNLPDTEHLSAGFADRLAPASEEGPPPPNVDHIGVAPVGSSLGEEKEFKPLQIDLSHLSMGE